MKTAFLLISAVLACLLFSCVASTRNCHSTDIEQIDTCLIGKTLEACIQKLNVTPSDFIPHRIFYREVHGIYIRLSDTCKITLIVDKHYQMNDMEAAGDFNTFYRHILKRKVKGICWRKEKKQQVKTLGDVNYAGCLSI
jgi:hypothetical protein